MSDLNDLKRRAGIMEQGNDAVAQAYRAINQANQALRALEGSAPGVKEAREHFSQGLDILSRGGSWR